MEINAIVDQLNSSGACPSYAVRFATKHDTSPGSCCPVAIGKALKDMWLEMQDEISDDEDELIEVNGTHENTPVKVIAPKSSIPTPASNRCPECGEPIVHEGGCDICKNCGWSKCM